MLVTSSTTSAFSLMILVQLADSYPSLCPGDHLRPHSLRQHLAGPQSSS